MNSSSSSSPVSDSPSPAVSVLLPVFNAFHTIAKAVQSILDQSFQDFELIIIDDGSTDDTRKVLEQFVDNRIKKYFLSHRGIAKTLNFGLKTSRGTFIARMDADDYSYPDRLNNQAAHLKVNPDVGLVSCLVEYYGDRQENTGYALYVDWLNEIRNSEDIYLRRFQESPIAHPSVMFRRELIGRYGGYSEEKLPEDYELWLRWMALNVKMAKLDEVLYRWTDSSSRLSRTHHNYDISNFYSLKAKYLSRFLKKEFKKSTTPEIWVWGTGKSAQKRAYYLTDYALNVSKYIEVKPPPYQNNDLIYYKNLPSPGNRIILSYVSDRVGKQQIQQYLGEVGYVEGTDYFMMS